MSEGGPETRSVAPPGAGDRARGLGPSAASGRAAIPGDADDTRGRHMRRLLRSPAVLSLGGTLVIAAFVIGTMAAGPGSGAAAAGAAALVVLGVVFTVASRRAHEDFFNAYAKGRGLQRIGERSRLPGASPLLRKGDRRYCTEQLRGALPGGLEGTLAHYAYEVDSTDSDGRRQTSTYEFTVATAQIPETAPYIGEVLAQRRSGFRFLDGLEDAFRRRKRVELESIEADRRYEIFIGERDDMNRALQIFSPSFIVWLADRAPDEFAFELVAGTLVCNVKGHKKSASELDSICESAAAVATRLREEALE